MTEVSTVDHRGGPFDESLYQGIGIPAAGQDVIGEL
jgi:hypothetical protein